MKPFLSAGLLGAALSGASCNSAPATDETVLTQAAKQAAQSPAQQARAAAWQKATAKPAPLPAGIPADLSKAVAELLPREGYLQLVSARLTGPGQPATLALPVLWRPTKPNYPPVAPGYRLPFEAVLRWQPTGYAPGERVPAAMTLRGPSAQDSLAGFTLVEGSAAATAQTVRANQPFTVRGTLYAYQATDQAQPALVLYPYRDPAGLPDRRKLITLPLHP